MARALFVLLILGIQIGVLAILPPTDEPLPPISQASSIMPTPEPTRQPPIPTLTLQPVVHPKTYYFPVIMNENIP